MWNELVKMARTTITSEISQYKHSMIAREALRMSLQYTVKEPIHMYFELA